jgi:hypothetical protein
MSVKPDTKEDVLDAAISGLPRVAEAILATPAESRIKAIDAVADSYRKTAQALLDEEETEQWLHDVLSRLRTEIAAKGLAQQGSEPQDEAPSLVPAPE